MDNHKQRNQRRVILRWFLCFPVVLLNRADPPHLAKQTVLVHLQDLAGTLTKQASGVQDNLRRV